MPRQLCVTGPDCNLVAVLIFTWPKFSFLREKKSFYFSFQSLKPRANQTIGGTQKAAPGSCSLETCPWNKPFVLAQLWEGQALYKTLPQDILQDMKFSRFTTVSATGKKTITGQSINRFLNFARESNSQLITTFFGQMDGSDTVFVFQRWLVKQLCCSSEFNSSAIYFNYT